MLRHVAPLVGLMTIGSTAFAVADCYMPPSSPGGTCFNRYTEAPMMTANRIYDAGWRITVAPWPGVGTLSAVTAFAFKDNGGMNELHGCQIYPARAVTSGGTISAGTCPSMPAAVSAYATK